MCAVAVNDGSSASFAESQNAYLTISIAISLGSFVSYEIAIYALTLIKVAWRIYKTASSGYRKHNWYILVTQSFRNPTHAQRTCRLNS